VRAWRVVAGTSPTTLTSLTTAARSGFETAIPVGAGAPVFAVQALGADGQVLGTSSATHA
jgi:hypothetical protein